MDHSTGEQQESRKDPMAGNDFASSIMLIVLSIVVIFWSLQMERPDGWGSAPSLLPLFLSGSIFFMGTALLISSIRNKGLSQLISKCRGFSLSRSVSSTKAKRTLWIILLTTFYVLVLLGRMPFELASFIYLTSTLYLFWRKGGWLKIMLISILLPFGISAIFRLVFVVFMPGESIFDWVLWYLE